MNNLMEADIDIQNIIKKRESQQKIEEYNEKQHYIKQLKESLQILESVEIGYTQELMRCWHNTELHKKTQEIISLAKEAFYLTTVELKRELKQGCKNNETRWC